MSLADTYGEETDKVPENPVRIKAAIEINAQLTRFVYRGQLTVEEAAERSVAQASALVKALEKSKPI